jgi:hypothetical protein
MKEIFAHMPEDLRKSITDAGLAQLAAVANVSGPNSTKFLEEFIKTGKYSRLAPEAQGGAGTIGKNGIDFTKLKAFLDGIASRVPDDPRMAMSSITGGDQDMAEGMVRLRENLGAGKLAAQAVAEATGNLNDEYYTSMGLTEAFAANINRVAAAAAKFTAPATQKATDVLSEASKTPEGAVAVAAGATLTAAALTGLAMSGIGGALGGTASAIAQTAGAEKVFGSKVTPVYVTNYGMFGSGGGGVGGLGLGGAAGGAGGLAGLSAGALTAGLALLGIGAVAGTGYLAKEHADKYVDDEKKHQESQIISHVMANPTLLDNPEVSMVFNAAMADRNQRTKNGGYTDAQMALKEQGPSEADKILGIANPQDAPAKATTRMSGRDERGRSGDINLHHKLTIEDKTGRLKVNLKTLSTGASNG